MSETIQVSPDMGELEALEPIGNAPLLPAHAVAGLALNMAIKYADITTVRDGALYQQYKLEGRNLQGLHLDYVFEIADRIERRIMEAPNRLATIIVGQLAEGLAAELAEEAGFEPEAEDECCPGCGACPGFIGADCDETCDHAKRGA